MYALSQENTLHQYEDGDEGKRPASQVPVGQHPLVADNAGPSEKKTHRHRRHHSHGHKKGKKKGHRRHRSQDEERKSETFIRKDKQVKSPPFAQAQPDPISDVKSAGIARPTSVDGSRITSGGMRASAQSAADEKGMYAGVKSPPIGQPDPISDVNSAGISGPSVDGRGIASAGTQAFDQSAANQKGVYMKHYDGDQEEARTAPTAMYGNEESACVTTKPGAFAVGPAGSRGPEMDEENQVYTSSDSSSQEAAEARWVSDNEVVQDHAEEIASMVQRRLMNNVTVPVDVQPSPLPKQQDDEASVNQRKRRYCLLAIAFLLIVAAVAAGVGVAVSKKNQEPSQTSPPAPTPTPLTQRAEAFKDILIPLSGEALEDDSSPQYMALDWIANTDSANMTIGVDSNERITRRYVAAVLYYAFEGSGWKKDYSFLSSSDICMWTQNDLSSTVKFGISCDPDGNTETLKLRENELKGSIPKEIGYYTNLNIIDLTNNTIDGTLANLENLTALEYIYLIGNDLTGSIPEFLLTHEHLMGLILDGNRIAGTLSPSLGTSAHLQVFWLRENELTGQVPSTIGSNTVLRSVDLASNKLTGAIPEFSSSTLNHLWLSNNRLAGSISRSVGSLSSLEYLFLAGNRLTGTIPTDLGHCKRLVHADFDDNLLTGDLGPLINSLPRGLESFDIGSNQLGGTIPTSIGALTKLSYFDIQENTVRGILPSEIGLSELEILNLAYNALSGPVPATVSNLLKLTDVRLQGNGFTGSTDAFCGLDLDFFAANTCSDPERIECTCCTHCCDEGAEFCEWV